MRPSGMLLRVPLDQTADDEARAAGAADLDAEAAIRAAPAGIENGLNYGFCLGHYVVHHPLMQCDYDAPMRR